MQFQDIFANFYTRYRGDSVIPAVTDPEWSIAVRYGNDAIRRWAEVDGENWPELITSAKKNGNIYTYTNISSLPTESTFICPDNMRRPLGWVRMTDPISNNGFDLHVISRDHKQFYDPSTPYAYFQGDPNSGYILVINLQGNTYQNYNVNFQYYKLPTLFNQATNSDGTVQEDGTTVSECPDPQFLVNYILAFRYLSSRNYPSYQVAKADAEEALKGMQTKNGIGTQGDPWVVLDTSGSFGSSSGGFGF